MPALMSTKESSVEEFNVIPTVCLISVYWLDSRRLGNQNIGLTLGTYEIQELVRVVDLYQAKLKPS